MVATESYDFVVTVLPCAIGSYTTVTTVDDITMSVIDPAVTSTSYEFIQTPVCGYPEVVTLTGLPSFVTHNVATRDFTIAPSDDSHIGIFTVDVVCKISVPDNPEKSSFTEYTQTDSFTITIEPCMPTSFNIITPVADIFQNVGAAGQTSNNYAFKQVPDCGLTPLVTVSNDPAFV